MMAREYTRDWYLERISWIKAAKRPISLSTDIIVGFPGETPDDFIETMDLLQEVEYDCVFGFKYSARPNTPALTMIDSIPEQREVARGFRCCLTGSARFRGVNYSKQIGQILEVMVENINTGAWADWRPQQPEQAGEFYGYAAHRSCARELHAGEDYRCISQQSGGRGRLTAVRGGTSMDIEVRIRGLMMDPATNMPIVVLKDVASETVMPIWVGIFEANAIAIEIEKAGRAAPDDARPDQESHPIT